jgi:hypothetical protein
VTGDWTTFSWCGERGVLSQDRACGCGMPGLFCTSEDETNWNNEGPGMSQQPYDDKLMPDALRLDFCVPNRAQQDVNLREFEAGSYPKGILPPGCTR